MAAHETEKRHLAEEVESTVATRDYVEMVVTREVQNLRVEVQRSFTQLNSEITNRLVTQFRWLLGWLGLVTVGILVDLLVVREQSPTPPARRGGGRAGR